MLAVQEDLFFGKREPPCVKSMVKDSSAFLDWLDGLVISVGQVDSFYTATYLCMQRCRGKSVPHRVWSSLVWAEESMKISWCARE